MSSFAGIIQIKFNRMISERSISFYAIAVQGGNDIGNARKSEHRFHAAFIIYLDQLIVPSEPASWSFEVVLRNEFFSHDLGGTIDEEKSLQIVESVVPKGFF